MQDPDTGYLIPAFTPCADAIAYAKRWVATDRALRTFTIGERVKVKDGTFKIVAIGRRFIRLEGIPEDAPEA